jgi:hypothetical protein
MGKITQEMIEVSYEYGKMNNNNEISLECASEKITQETGMNKRSAENSLKNMKCLLNEEDYFYTMNADETIWRLEKIKEDYGRENTTTSILAASTKNCSPLGHRGEHADSSREGRGDTSDEDIPVLDVR